MAAAANSPADWIGKIGNADFADRHPPRLAFFSYGQRLQQLAHKAKEAGSMAKPNEGMTALELERMVPIRSKTRSPTAEHLTGLSYYTLRRNFAQYIQKLPPTNRIAMRVRDALAIANGTAK